MRFTIVIFFTCLLFSGIWFGCTKESLEEIHIDTTITDNDPPPYSGVSDAQLTNYINKLYIDLIGRAPTAAEISSQLAYLENHALRDGAKDTLVQELMNTEDYYDVIFSLTSADFTNAIDSADIDYEIQVITLIYYIDSLNGNFQNFIFYQFELNRLYHLLSITDNYRNGSISVNEFFAAFLNNYFYDQVNMGSENFVKGAFSDLFRRAPTQSELTNGITMTDNGAAILFLKDGDSKGDFISIVTTCTEFYEGLVLKTYNQLLLRDPTSAELASATFTLEQNNNYPAFQKQLVKTSEYAGF